MDTSKAQADQIEFEVKFFGRSIADYRNVLEWSPIEPRTAYQIIDKEYQGDEGKIKPAFEEMGTKEGHKIGGLTIRISNLASAHVASPPKSLLVNDSCAGASFE